jgi:hypothetical protein
MNTATIIYYLPITTIITMSASPASVAASEPLPFLPVFLLEKKLNPDWAWYEEECTISDECRVNKMLVAAKDKTAARLAVGEEIYAVNEGTDWRCRVHPTKLVTKKRFSCYEVSASSPYTEETIISVEHFFVKKRDARDTWKSQTDRRGGRYYSQHEVDAEDHTEAHDQNYESPEYDSDCVHSM